MCGICGIYRAPAVEPGALTDPVNRMCAAMHHRGPDDLGTYADPGHVVLGNTRLAIIDLSPHGHQPMSDDRGEVWVTNNGEIYNFRALREELAAKGYRFRTRSDTEVLVYLYREHGPDMVRRLQGMFALALWDRPRQQLCLARDRLGIKPLYYAQDTRGLVFASEIKALVASGLVRGDPNPAAVTAFLRLGSVPTPLTAMSDVHELPPGSCLVARGPDVQLLHYWDIPVPDDGPVDPVATLNELRHRLMTAVDSHLVSDVPLGVFLSGGVDSTSIVALMRAAGHEQVRTFAIAFREGVNEAPFASAVAAQFRTQHTERVIGPADLQAELDDIVAAMDQPTVDGVNTYFVSQVTRESGTIVALSGLGGDELFAGYPSFRLLPRIQQARHVLGKIPGLAPAAAWMLGRINGRRSNRLGEALQNGDGLRRAYLSVRELFSAVELSALVHPDVLERAKGAFDPIAYLPELTASSDPVASVARLELRAYMHNQLLRDTDVMSMAHSLEARVPFLDHELVEFVSRLPSKLRSRGRGIKPLLTRALDPWLPPQITSRAKQGFTFPIGHWLRGPLRPLAHEAIAAAGENGWFRSASVWKLWRSFLDGHAHWAQVWAIVVAQRWLARHHGTRAPAGRAAGSL